MPLVKVIRHGFEFWEMTAAPKGQALEALPARREREIDEKRPGVDYGEEADEPGKETLVITRADAIAQSNLRPLTAQEEIALEEEAEFARRALERAAKVGDAALDCFQGGWAAKVRQFVASKNGEAFTPHEMFGTMETDSFARQKLFNALNQLATAGKLWKWGKGCEAIYQEIFDSPGTPERVVPTDGFPCQTLDGNAVAAGGASSLIEQPKAESSEGEDAI